MAKMKEDDLLAMLQSLETEAASFATSTLAPQREMAMREYFRAPYGTEEEGWSQVVTSDVQDTVEWMLPDLLDIFTSSDEAVQFEPQTGDDVAGAQQATDTCNYIFYRQNNGFFVLYTAIKDALLSKNCAVTWRKYSERTKTVVPVTGASAEVLALILDSMGADAELESVELFDPATDTPQPKGPPPMPQAGPPPGLPGPPQGPPQAGPGGPPPGAPGMPPQGPPQAGFSMPPPGPNGARGYMPNMAPGGQQMPPGVMPPQLMPAVQPPMQPMAMAPQQQLFNARIAKWTNKTSIRIEAFAPEDLLVQRDWTSPLLHDCPYVARNMLVTLSDLDQMGFTDVTADELAASGDAVLGQDRSYRRYRDGNASVTNDSQVNAEDESQTRGYIRVEYVLVDFDGDGVAERREIIRLEDRILSNEEVTSVPIATGTPVIVPHRWDGLSMAEIVSDIQQIRTELTRQMLNNAYLANNPRKKVLTDVNWSPLANIDDLLDGRPGGVLRQRQQDAITIDQTPWIGGNIFPMLDYMDSSREQRTGVSKQQQGLDPNSLRPDRTATEIQMTATAARQRIRLVARILAETLIKPIFEGVFQLLTQGDMKPIAFRLRGEFVEYDPNEWHDHYDMTINVGLGTGDRSQQAALLQQILVNQMQMAQTPFGQLLITPQQIYNTQAKITVNAGFKDVDNYWTNPKGKPLPPANPPPDPAVQVANIKAQADTQQAVMKAQTDAQITQLRANQEAQLAQIQAAHDAQLETLRIQGQQENARANLALQATNDQRDAEREAMRASYTQQNAAADRELEWQKAQLDASTRWQIAQLQSSTQVATTQQKTEATKEVAAKRQPPQGATNAQG